MIVFYDDGHAEASELLDLYVREGWSNYTRDPEGAARGLAASLRLITAREDGALVGFARLLGDGASLLLVQDLIVRAEFRGRGVGSELLSRAERAFPGARAVMLMTDIGSENVGFYEARGYVKAERAGLQLMLKRPPRPALLVFVDGAVADDRHRLGLPASPEGMLADLPVKGAVGCLRALSERYEIVYISARAPEAGVLTRGWLAKSGFPDGELLLSETYPGRLELALEARKKHNFVAGIGDRYDGNALHQELGIRSVIVKEYEGDWESVSRWLNA